MSISISVIIGLVVFLLIIALLIIGIMYGAKKNADNKTELTIEIPKLFKVHFKQENHKKHS